MQTIFEYLRSDTRAVSYIARSMSGCWSISYKKYDNYTGVSLSSYQKLSDTDIEALRELGYIVFDFKSLDTPLNLFKEMEALNEKECN